mmetsp:Transcript_90810/g.143480  ORF Transcript_90810/g.143480 Transcript_90810/m.143480 type:complete len:361 (-) Transcript_90810:100-1182(-)
MKPAGRDVIAFNDDLFSQLRKKSGINDDFVNSGWSFDSLESSGAKGGCLLAFVGSEFVVKELSTSDHHSLLAISSSYFEHVSSGETLLSGILLHFEDTATSRKFVVMRNVVGSGPFLAMYDLKGCNDDKTLQLFGSKIQAASSFISNVGWICGYPGSQDWYAYSAGKYAAARAELVVTESQREEVVRKIRRDTSWLARHALMDYSLMVGVKILPAGSTPAASFGQTPLARRCSDGSMLVLSIGIIDFLQQWNMKKICARAIKCLECNKATIPPAAYARRFNDHFEDRFVSVKEAEDRTSFGKAHQLEMADALCERIDSDKVSQAVARCSSPSEALYEDGALLDRVLEAPTVVGAQACLAR